MDSLVENLSFSSNCRVAEWMNLLCSCRIWQEIWQPVQDENSVRIGLLVVGHVMAKEDPPPSLDNAYESEWFKNLWQLKLTLAGNPVVCETLEDLWNEHKLVASAICGATLSTMALGLVDIHPNIVNPGLKNFLQMKSPNFPTDIVNGEQVICEQTVNNAVLQFVDLVNEVKHLELDAGHWHELWEEGESIGLCIILHYIKHEKRSRLEQLGRIRNVNACINSNIRKLKSALAAFPDLVLELIKLWKRRPDIAKHIDGDTLRELANDLRGDVTKVQRCFAHLSKKLPDRWGDEYGRAQKPTAYLYTCVHNFIHGPDHMPDLPPQSTSPTFSLSSFPQQGQQLPSPRFPFVPNGLPGPQQGPLSSPRFPLFPTPSSDLPLSQNPFPSPRFSMASPSKPTSPQNLFTSPRFQLLSQLSNSAHPHNNLPDLGSWNPEDLLPQGHTASAPTTEPWQSPLGCHNSLQQPHSQGPKLKAHHSRRPSVWAQPNATGSSLESGLSRPQSVWSHSTGSSSTLMTGRSSPQSICPESPESSFTTVSRPDYELIQSSLLLEGEEEAVAYLRGQGLEADSTSVNKVQSWLQWGDSWQNQVAGGLVGNMI